MSQPIDRRNPPTAGSSPHEAGETWTTRRLIGWMSEYFAQKSLDSPRLLAEILLSNIFDCDRLRLYTDADRPASKDELARLRSLVARAGRQEPVQYLTGESWFFGLRFEVTPATLIPRPSTETIVEYLLQRERAGSGESIDIVDLGTGTGCIAIALAVNLPASRIVATDISAEALEVARRNAEAHGVTDRIQFRCGSLFSPLESNETSDEPEENQRPVGRYDYVLSNPPYISDHEWVDVAANIRDYEPHAALRAGPRGLDFLEPLIQGVSPYLRRPNGLALFEIASSQSDSTRACAASNASIRVVEILPDLEGHPRVLVLAPRVT